jgi:glutamate--cysteine ligase catalytic subunit
MFIGQPLTENERQALVAVNDVEAEVDEDTKNFLISNGLDQQLASHIAHLFTRDPLVIFNDSIVLDDSTTMEHFENIQSTNWRTIRWKPPVLGADTNGGPGWRVEFRPLEVQLTDFENAAYAIFVVLLSRSLLAMGHSFYMPMSLVEENMNRSMKKDAVLTQKFWFNRNSLGKIPLADFESDILAQAVCNHDIAEMSLDEIMNGGNSFCGLIPSVEWYLEALGCDSATMSQISPYLDLLRKRASGKLPTTARWIRNFVKSQSMGPDTSYLSSEVADKLMQVCEDIGLGCFDTAELNGMSITEKTKKKEFYDCCFSGSNSAQILLGLPGAANAVSFVCPGVNKTSNSQSLCEG